MFTRVVVQQVAVERRCRLMADARNAHIIHDASATPAVSQRSGGTVLHWSRPVRAVVATLHRP